MGPKPGDDAFQELLRAGLINLIDQRHELVRLTELVDGDALSQKLSPQFVSTRGWSAPRMRLMAALLYVSV
jgi:hypothetical protein